MSLLKKYELNYPKDVKENLVWRNELLELCLRDIQFSSLVYEKCRRDILFYFNAFAYTFEPRVDHNHLPFVTYPFQDEYIETIWKSITTELDTLTEKSRDMGATWMCVTIFLYGWNFHGHQYLVGSRTEDKVDAMGSLDTLFGKLRYNLSFLPKQFLPKGFDLRTHSNYMKLVNPSNGNAVIGESTNENFSRQGRYKAILLDEFAFVEKADSIWQAAGDSAPCRLPISTVHGIGNKFAELRMSNKIKVCTLHWSKHPKKTPEWYEAEKMRRDEVAVAQELDINYMASAGRARFDKNVLSELFRKAKDPLPGESGLQIYDYPQDRYPYVIGVDCSEGLVTGDNSAISVMNCKNYSIDAEYAGKVEPSELARLVKIWAEYYNNALVVVEDNNHGLAVIIELKRNYHKLYYRKSFDEITDSWTQKVGWRTSARTKPILVAHIDKALKDGLIVPSREIISELMNYIIDDNGSTNASQGNHDDRVIALGCALQGYIESPKNVLPEPEPEIRPNTVAWLMKKNKEEQDALKYGHHRADRKNWAVA